MKRLSDQYSLSIVRRQGQYIIREHIPERQTNMDAEALYREAFSLRHIKDRAST
jgi:hypothetical protein